MPSLYKHQINRELQVCGILALSRALGDCELQDCITWMPDIQYDPPPSRV